MAARLAPGRERDMVGPASAGAASAMFLGHPDFVTIAPRRQRWWVSLMTALGLVRLTWLPMVASPLLLGRVASRQQRLSILLLLNLSRPAKSFLQGVPVLGGNGFLNLSGAELGFELDGQNSQDLVTISPTRIRGDGSRDKVCNGTQIETAHAALLNFSVLSDDGRVVGRCGHDTGGSESEGKKKVFELHGEDGCVDGYVIESMRWSGQSEVFL